MPPGSHFAGQVSSVYQKGELTAGVEFIDHSRYILLLPCWFTDISSHSPNALQPIYVSVAGDGANGRERAHQYVDDEYVIFWSMEDLNRQR